MSGVIGPKVSSQVSEKPEIFKVAAVGDTAKVAAKGVGDAAKDVGDEDVYKDRGGITAGKFNPNSVDFAGKGIPQNTESTVENIRNAKGNERDNALLGFQEKVDSMGTKDLKSMRDYLVKEMSSPNNKDDELLGSMLNMVNHKLDQKGNEKPIFEKLIHKEPIHTGEQNLYKNSNVEKKLPL